jgi:hypothetical protein
MNHEDARQYLSDVVDDTMCEGCQGWPQGYELWFGAAGTHYALEAPADFKIHAWPVPEYEQHGVSVSFDEAEYDNPVSLNLLGFYETAVPQDMRVFHLDDESLILCWKDIDGYEFEMVLFFAPVESPGQVPLPMSAIDALQRIEESLGAEPNEVLPPTICMLPPTLSPSDKSYEVSMLCDVLVLVAKVADEEVVNSWEEQDRLLTVAWSSAELIELCGGEKNSKTLPDCVDQLEDI